MVNKKRERASKIITEKENRSGEKRNEYISKVFLYQENIIKKFMPINL